MLILALESSTSAAKALLYEVGRGIVREASMPYPSTWERGTQHAPEVYQSLARVGREVASGLDVDAIGLGGTYHSIGAFDVDFEPVGPVYTWEYLKSGELCASMRKDESLTSELYDRTGCMPNVTYARQTLLYLKRQGMSFEGRRLMSQSAYNFYRITGQFAETDSTASGGGLLNLKSREYDELTLSLLGIDSSQMGRLIGYEDVGRLGREAAKDLGLREGTKVVPPFPDGALNQIGSGAASSGRMTMSVGTSAAIRLTTPRPITPPKRQTWCYRGVNGYLSGAAINGACNCVNWFRDMLMSGRVSFPELESGLDMPPHPPVFLPFLFAERCPGWRDDRRGGFFDLDAAHTPQDMYWAVQAGILFNLYQCYEALIPIAGTPADIIVSGGILHSERWTRMIADLFGRTILRSENSNASLMGAVALGLHAAGGLDNIEDFTIERDHAAPVEPDTSKASYYKEQFARYMDWYERT